MSLTPLTVSSNGLPIPFTPEYFCELEDCTPLIEDPLALVNFYRSHHYLYLKNFLDREYVLQVRDNYFRRFDPSFFKEGTTPKEGIFSGLISATLPRHGTPSHPAYEMVRDEEFDAFVRHPKLFELAESLLGKPVQQLRRRPLRHFMKNTRSASRAHTDAIYIEQPAITFWIPIGDCPLEAGGLVYLEGLHPENLEPIRALIGQNRDRQEDKRPLTNDLKFLAEKTGGRWLWSDYQAGDITVHSPYIIHASLDSSAELMRISTDIRFVARDEPIDPRWTKDWSADDTY